MKIPLSVNLLPMAPWVRDIVTGVPGAELLPARTGADLLLTMDGRQVPVQLKAVRNVDAARARMIADTAAADETLTVVIAQTITALARQFLESQGVGYIDGQGFAHLRAPGIYVHVAADRPRRSDRRPRVPARLSGKAGLVAQVLLLDPDRAWQIAEVADATRGHADPDASAVSAGLVHRVLVRLEQAGVLRTEGSGPRRRRSLTNAGALLDLLREENAEPLLRRHPIYVFEPIPGSLGSGVSRSLRAHDIHHAVTGNAAAAIEAPMLSAVPVSEVRVEAAADPAAITSMLSARPVDRGANCVLLQGQDDTELVLRRDVRGLWLAAPPRVYLDAFRDPRRGEEQAEHYRRTILKL